MSDSELNEFSVSFHQDIAMEAHAQEALRETVYVEKMGEILEDHGEVESIIISPYQKTGVKVDGYYYDADLGDFTLVISDFIDNSNINDLKVSNKDVEKSFKRVTNFFIKSLDGLKDKIEIANEAFELASLINECQKEIRSVKFILLTDGQAPRKEADVKEHQGISLTYTIWDLDRTHHFLKTGEREAININLTDYCNGPLPCVILEEEGYPYTTYLGFIPGKALADMYARWGIKMLDLNVRVFLSARGKVNKNIRETIENDPNMFCAYNNGITVFANSVDLDNSNGIGLINVSDFQIVNGGQTTASLFHARKKLKANLENIYVQMKLTVIKPNGDKENMVQKVSEYSNTQNKVQTADLAANQPPHPEIQAISNSKPAPDPTGGSKMTFWFYEKSRGSYEEQRNLTATTKTQQKKYDELRPKAQKFDKIKFGKVWNTYLQLPHVVSLGGQKNFSIFNEWLRGLEDEDFVVFFQKTVSLLIIWNETIRLVRKKKFQGYQHNIVSYTLAWIFHLSKSRIDLEKIWNKQKVAESIMEEISEMSDVVNIHIRDTDLNVTEYCKKKDCWDGLLGKKYKLSNRIKKEYIKEGVGKKYKPSLSSEEENIKFCIKLGSDAWLSLSKWIKEMKYLGKKQISQAHNMGIALKNNKEPSAILSYACKKIWDDSIIRGWDYERFKLSEKVK